MVRILSTGTAFNIAATTGDAGQLGMAAEFDGYFSGPISRLIHCMGGLVLGDFDGGDRFKWDVPRGDRPWANLFLWLWQSLRLTGCLALGDSPLGRPCQRLSWPYPHYFSQHSVYQH